MKPEAKTWHGMDFVRIPKGEFIMGSKDDNELGFGDEIPQHRLEISYDYWIGKYPVTNAQFRAFVHSTGFETCAEHDGWCWVWNVKDEQWERMDGANWNHPLGASRSISDIDEHPVVNVCWYDVTEFCKWLNQNPDNPLQQGYHFRLPSEAEWEKAARGPNGREWPWGNHFNPAFCNSKEAGMSGTTPVRMHSPLGDSLYGVADLSGNVWNWSISLWGINQDKAEFVYPYLGTDGREDQLADEKHYRVIRGGSFKDDIRGVRCACRDIDPPLYSLNNLGFRVVVAPR